MCRMLGSHTGKHLARALEALLKGFGIEKKVGFLFVYSHCFMSKLTLIRYWPLYATMHLIMT